MITQSLLSLAAGADTRSNYLIRLACRWADRADRAGLRSDRLRHLGEAWAILTSPHWAVVRVQLDRPVRYHDGSGDDHETLAPEDVEVQS